MFVLPINRDDGPTGTPWAVISLIFLNTASLLLVFSLHLSSTVALQYGFVPAHPELKTALSSLFIHAGVLHLLGNMWFLWMFGKQVEDELGVVVFLLSYIACGLGGTALHWALNQGSLVPCVGASGAISGIAGMFFVMFPRSPFDLTFYLGWWRVGNVSTYTLAAVGAWIGEQAILGLITLRSHTTWIAFWAHVGGFVVGVALGILFRFIRS